MQSHYAMVGNCYDAAHLVLVLLALLGVLDDR
jgi:hypothetical protein